MCAVGGLEAGGNAVAAPERHPSRPRRPQFSAMTSGVAFALVIVLVAGLGFALGFLGLGLGLLLRLFKRDDLQVGLALAGEGVEDLAVLVGDDEIAGLGGLVDGVLAHRCLLGLGC